MYTFYYIYLSKDLSDIRRSRESLEIILAWFFIIILFYVFGYHKFLFLYWLVPQFYVLSMCLYWSEIQDHFNVKNGTTRTNINLLENLLFTHNNGFHEIHHRDTRIPWYHLKKAHFSNSHLLKSQVSKGIFGTFKQIVGY